MINNIETIKSYSPRYIKEFVRNCTVEEKIDAHYITVQIISGAEIQFVKANGNVIDRVDMILNSMWNKLFVDWNYLRMSNVDWFEHHKGFSIKMFFLPCSKPITTKYDDNLRYIFDRAVYNDTEIDVKEVLKDIVFPSAYKVGFKCTMLKKKLTDNALNEFLLQLMSSDSNSSECFISIIDGESTKFAIEEPEGYIFKYKNKIFQTASSSRQISSEKASYEFLLSDFIKYCKSTNYIAKISQSYIKSVCSLFNDYIINFEKLSNTMMKNITAESIEAPYLGARFEMGYSYIPDQITKMLCKENKLYENIFKVFLANLQKGKDVKQCIILNRKQVDDWNNIVKNIKIRTGFQK